MRDSVERCVLAVSVRDALCYVSACLCQHLLWPAVVFAIKTNVVKFDMLPSVEIYCFPAVTCAMRMPGLECGICEMPPSVRILYHFDLFVRPCDA